MHSKNTYFPERFRQRCPFATEIAREYAERSRAAGGPLLFHYEKILSWVGPIGMTHYQTAIADMELDGVNTAGLEKNLSVMMVMAVWYARFSYYGKQVFELTPDLADEFLHTDVDAVIASDLVFPFPVIYLHWGARDDFRLDEGQPEGAYIQEIKPGIQYEVNIVFAAEDNDVVPDRQAWIRDAPVWLSLSLSLVNPNASIDEIIMHSIDSAKVAESKTRKADDENDRDYVIRVIPRLSGRREVASKVLRLVTNALLYLDQLGAREKPVWPAGTPPGMLAKLASAGEGSKQGKKLLSQLSSMGFMPVHLIAAAEPLPGLQEGLGMASGARHAAHWRRGHWRRQAFGPGRAERKLIRIRPVWVGAAAPGAQPDESGRAYQVKNTTT